MGVKGLNLSIEEKKIRKSFYNVKYRLKQRLIQEQALSSASDGVTSSVIKKTLFKNTNFTKVYTEGITRKQGNTTVRYVGIEAIKIQIKSLSQRASIKYQNRLYIQNYQKAMSVAGFSDEDIELVGHILSKIQPKKLSILIQKGRIEEISFFYGSPNENARNTVIGKIQNLDKIINEKEFNKIIENYKDILPLKKKEYDIISRRKNE